MKRTKHTKSREYEFPINLNEEIRARAAMQFREISFEDTARVAVNAGVSVQFIVHECRK